MAITTSTASAFHAGELAAQDKAGTRGVAAELAVAKGTTLRFASNHDGFLASQSFAVVTSVDHDNNDDVWVTPLFGKPGDIMAISETEILISTDCIPKFDILHKAVGKKATTTPLSLLGIDLLKRIRHRINGVALGAANDNAKENLHLQVKEYSPNCPKYINRRELIPGKNPINPYAIRDKKPRTQMTQSDQEFVSSMDTLWLGTYYAGGGADTNHRGGKTGFIRIISSTTIEWPEYRGNGMFFSSGNIELNEMAGVTLIDFDTGSMIQMTGRAKVDWQQHDGSYYEGATRKITFHIDQLLRTNNVTDHRWKRLDYSPYNPNVDVVVQDHSQQLQSGGSRSRRSSENDYPITVTLAKIVQESRNVKTFRWVAQRNIPFLPGQYATFEFFDKIPSSFSSSSREVRTWTLSETPNSIRGDNTLDITVKRKGLVSNWLHDHAQLGMQVQLNGIQGDSMTALKFVDDDDNSRNNNININKAKATVPEHLLLLSAGIGITPNLATVRGIGAFELQDSTNIIMIHVERYEQDLIAQSELYRRSKNYPNFSYTNVISSKEGRLTKNKLADLLLDNRSKEEAPATELFQAYVCGPNQFMTDMTEHLVSLGLPAANIHTESFDF